MHMQKALSPITSVAPPVEHITGLSVMGGYLTAFWPANGMRPCCTYAPVVRVSTRAYARVIVN